MPISDVRQPELLVLANGFPLTGVIEAQISSNNHYSADCFSICLALNADPAALAMLSSVDDVAIEIQIGFGAGPPVSLFQGSADTIEVQFIRGLILLQGRDFTSLLIEARTQETFVNNTSSEIALILAARHGLAAEVADTATPVGRYYQDEHDRITLDEFSRASTEWDLLVFLARQEQFDVYVQGRTLFFQPRNASPTPVTLSPVDLLDLSLERNLLLSGDIEVTVKSWNSRLNNAFTQVVRSSLGLTQNAGQPQRYVVVRPNLTPDQALKLAQQTLAELTRHERVLSATMPGDVTLTARSAVTLSGTGSAFDTTYYVDSVERCFDLGSGFVQHVLCRTLPSTSQATPPGDLVQSVTG